MTCILCLWPSFTRISAQGQLPFESPQLLFLGGLMPTAWKRFLTMLGQLLAPLRDRGVGDAQLTGDLRDWLPAGLGQMLGFALQLLRLGLLDFCHDPCSPFGTVYPKISLFHQSGARSIC